MALASGARSSARVRLVPTGTAVLLLAVTPWVSQAARPRDASLSGGSQQSDSSHAATAMAVYQAMADLADATTRWSSKALGIRLRPAWRVAGPRVAFVTIAAHRGGSQHHLQNASGREQPEGDGPEEGSGDYPGDTSDGKFPRYEKGINNMIDQCKKPKEIKEKAMEGKDTRAALEVNRHMLEEYRKCVERIHEMARLVQEAGEHSAAKNKEYTADVIKFLHELAFIEDYTKSFNNINADFLKGSNYLLKESHKVIKYLDDLVNRGDPIPVESSEPSHLPPC